MELWKRRYLFAANVRERNTTFLMLSNLKLFTLLSLFPRISIIIKSFLGFMVFGGRVYLATLPVHSANALQKW